MTNTPAPNEAISARTALLALLLVVPAPSIGAWVSFWLAPGAIGVATYALCKAILYITPALWHVLVDRRAITFSAPKREARSGWLIGIGIGLLTGGAIVLTWRLLGDSAIDIERFRDILAKNKIGEPLPFLIAATYFTFVNSALEEYAFRWFVTTRFEAVVPRPAFAPTLLSALAFTAHHVIVLLAYLPLGPALLASFGVFAGGLIWSWLYRRTRSIWPSWISHALVDTAIMAIGYYVLVR
jgi:uncharacterized protein